MRDNAQRQIDYLRLSVTQRCNLNCRYCGHAEPVRAEDELTPVQIETLVRAFAACGIRKVRLTGGEPLVRDDLADIARAVRRAKGIETVNVTTNGIALTTALARSLKAAGVDRANISLDSLDKETYKTVTGGGNLDAALRGVEAALVARLTPLHINVVLMRGVNAGEIDEFIRYAKEHPVTVRFIELMPFSVEDSATAMVPNNEILARHAYLSRVEGGDASQPSADYTAPGWRGQVGFISPVTDKFCNRCNRVRLLSNGTLKPCLGSETVTELLPWIESEDTLINTIRRAIAQKPEGHHFERGCTAGQTLQNIGG